MTSEVKSPLFFYLMLQEERTYFCVFFQLEVFWFFFLILLGGFEMIIDTKVKITSKGLQFSISSMQLPPSFRILLFCMVYLTKKQDLPCSLIL